MNWIGGSRARAKARQEQFNMRFNRQLDNPHEDQEITNGEISRDLNQENLLPRCSAARKRRACSGNDPDEDHNHSQSQEGDNNGEDESNIPQVPPGFRLVRPPVQRRVVPLLEFTRRKIPRGHIICLILEHQLDITRVPAPSEQLSQQQQLELLELDTPTSFRQVATTTPTPTSTTTGAPDASQSTSD